MYLVEVAPQRWTVREEKIGAGDDTWIKGYRRGKPGVGKLLGTIEFHEFWTYKDDVRVKDGFWIARPPNSGWKETGWKQVATKDEAIAMLKKGSKHGKKRKSS